MSPDEATTAAHLTDLAAFVRQQRAQGWRQAIEALRDDAEYGSWDLAQDPPRMLISAGDRAVAADFLESLAPKETDQP